MDRLGMLSENAQPERSLPSLRSKMVGRQAKTYSQRPKGRLSLKKQHRSSAKKRVRPTEATPRQTNPLKVTRCALQTLGGDGTSNTRSPAPLKGDAVYKIQSNEATLRKMRPYGGNMFYDKCYLSSEDEREAETEERGSWALSPSDEAVFARASTSASSKRKKYASSESTRRIPRSDGKKGRKATGTDPFSMSPAEADKLSCSESFVDFDDHEDDSVEESEHWITDNDSTIKKPTRTVKPTRSKPKKATGLPPDPLQSTPTKSQGDHQAGSNPGRQQYDHYRPHVITPGMTVSAPSTRADPREY